MNAKDLMIGDWVRMPFGLPEIRQIKYPSEIDDADFYEPIPLTAEILEKNGFEKFGENAYSFRRRGGDGEIKIKVIDLTCGEWELYAMDYDKYRDSCTSFSKEVSFLKVHELQHALRLCGIEKEIEL